MAGRDTLPHFGAQNETEVCNAYCKRCKSNGVFVRNVNRPNHILHALLSLFLCCLWLPVWAIVCANMEHTSWVCDRCGWWE